MEVGDAKAVYSRLENSAADGPPANCSYEQDLGVANPLFSEERFSKSRLNSPGVILENAGLCSKKPIASLRSIEESIGDKLCK
jgi:hypothetical protein